MNARPAFFLCVAALVVGVFAGCSSSNGSSESSSPDGSSSNTDPLMGCVPTPVCPAKPPSYQADVAPLIKKYCLGCHSPDNSEEGPLLDDYAGVKGSLGDVRIDVVSCEMPISRPFPSDEDRDVILSWIACGGPNN